MENQKWKIGKFKSVVVSDTKIKNTNFPSPPNPDYSEDNELEYYGGYLICESVANDKIAQLISAAPDMLEALQNLENDNNVIPEHAWKLIKDAIAKAVGNFKG